MPHFHLRTRPHPDEVTVAIGYNGVTASVAAPEGAGEIGCRDLRLSTALHFAGSLADRLGTDVAILDGGDTVFLIEDADPDLVFVDAD